MSYLISLFMMIFLFLPSSLMASKNPFSVNFESEPLKLQGEIRQTIKLSIRSDSIEGKKYHLKLNIPKTHMTILEGRDFYTGELGPLKNKDYYITVRLKREGEGKITSIIYGYMDDREIDMENPSKFVADYSVSKSIKTAGKDYLLSIASTNEQTGKTPNKEIQNDNTYIASVEKDEQEGQRFILDSKNRENSFIRSMLFVLSFFLIAWFAYRIINKRS